MRNGVKKTIGYIKTNQLHIYIPTGAELSYINNNNKTTFKQDNLTTSNPIHPHNNENAHEPLKKIILAAAAERSLASNT